jgi:hypothetical protein
VLRKKLATDLATASTVAKDTTVVAANLAARQAVIVGTTMISPEDEEGGQKDDCGVGSSGIEAMESV